MSASFKVRGLKDLEKALDQLSKSAGKGVLRRSLKKAAQPMADLAGSLAPVEEGDLSKSIIVSAKLEKNAARRHRKMFKDDRASVELFVGPDYGLGKGGRHGHLVEFGTDPHINAGQFAGTMHPGTAPQPFMRPAWDQDRTAMLDRLSRELWAELDKSLQRAARKAAKG